MNSPILMQRRRLLQAAVQAQMLCALAPAVLTSRAQARTTDGAAVRVTQLLDMSPDQQQLSRDYATGIRLAFAESRKASGLSVQLITVETDGTAAAARSAIQAIKDDPTQVALLGATGEGLALATLREVSQAHLDIANVAPWLSDSQFDGDPRLFGLFASREEQIRHVLNSLASMGVPELGVIYSSPRQAETMRQGTAAVTSHLKIRAREFTVPAGQDMARFASTLPADAPVFLLFMGGAIELALFTRGLGKSGMLRYVVCLSDVDANTFVQLNPGKSVPIIFTQVVPNPQSSKIPVVRAYRDALARLFDEEPTPVSLAGYLAGRYAANTLLAAGPNPSRARVLAEFQRRKPMEIDGWRLEFVEKGRASNFVGQTLLSVNGGFVG